jgi:hypothetical protein
MWTLWAIVSVRGSAGGYDRLLIYCERSVLWYQCDTEQSQVHPEYFNFNLWEECHDCRNKLARDLQWGRPFWFV